MKTALFKEGGLWAVLVLAFGLRAAGLHYGLPYLYHQDEPIIVNHAMSIGAAGWNTHFFIIPPFVIYGLFALYAAAYACGHVLGVFQNTDAFAAVFLSDPSYFYAAGRVLFGAIAGTATVAVLFYAGRRFLSERTGFLAALILSVLFFHVQHSHYLYVDATLTLTVALLLYQCLAILSGPSMGAFLRAGALIGWGASVKYTALYFLPTLFLAFFLAFPMDFWRPRTFGKLVGAGLMSLAVFFVLAPYTILDWGTFWTQITRQAGAESRVGYGHHLIYSLLGGTGFIFLAVVLSGALRLCVEKKGEAALLIGGSLVFYAINADFSQRYARYMLPLVSALCLLAAYALDALLSSTRRGPFFKTFFFVVFFTSLCLPTFYSDYLFLTTDTRTKALQWFRDNAPEGSVVVLDNRFYGPRLKPTRDQILEKYKALGNEPRDAARRKRLDIELRSVQRGGAYNVYVLQAKERGGSPSLFEGPYVPMGRDAFTDIRAEYFVLSYAYDNSAALGFIRSLQGSWEKVAAFSPYRDPSLRWSKDRYASTAAPHDPDELFSRDRLGPYLEVYKIKP